MKISVQQDYQRLREPEYPATGSQLDAIFKMAQALKETGVVLHADTEKWIEQCQAVKDKFPKNSF